MHMPTVHPLQEAAHLRSLADQKDPGGPEPESEAVVEIYRLISSDAGRAMMWRIEADALERGYLLGRVMAAYEVRTGLDKRHVNGGIRWDSDTSSPPIWLMETAERLARGFP